MPLFLFNMLTYNCADAAFTLQNDAFTVDPTELTISITILNSTCAGPTAEYLLQSGLSFDYNASNKSVYIPNDNMIDGDGIYLFEYSYDSVNYSSCTFVLCSGKCDIYNAIYNNIGTCTCQDSGLDKAYNIFMHVQVVQALTECDDCCKAVEVYDNLLELINGCATC